MDTVPRPRGRPITTGKTPMRQFRMSESEFAKVRAAAEVAGLSWSEWVRRVLVRAARGELRKKGPDEPDV